MRWDVYEMRWDVYEMRWDVYEMISFKLVMFKVTVKLYSFKPFRITSTFIPSHKAEKAETTVTVCRENKSCNGEAKSSNVSSCLCFCFVVVVVVVVFVFCLSVCLTCLFQETTHTQQKSQTKTQIKKKMPVKKNVDTHAKSKMTQEICSCCCCGY